MNANPHALVLFIAWPARASGIIEKTADQSAQDFVAGLHHRMKHGRRGLVRTLQGTLIGFMSPETLERYKQARRNQNANKAGGAAEAVEKLEDLRRTRWSFFRRFFYPLLSLINPEERGWDRYIKKETARDGGMMAYKHLPAIRCTESNGDFIRIELVITGTTALLRCLKFFA